MTILKKCWTPFMVYSWTTIKLGSYYAAVYTAVFHVLFICYALHVIDGGSSAQFYSPYFELNESGATVAGSLTIVFSFLFLFACGMLMYGIKHENRCTFYPWLIGMTLEILLMLSMGIWFLFRYYHNGFTFFATFLLYCVDGLHVYCLLCVISEYQMLKEMQEPRFIILHP